MAGKRREKGRPLKRVISAQRLRQRLDVELAGLTDPRDRVIAAADYVRAALARQPGRADAADQVVSDLRKAGDQILELESEAS